MAKTDPRTYTSEELERARERDRQRNEANERIFREWERTREAARHRETRASNASHAGWAPRWAFRIVLSV